MWFVADVRRTSRHCRGVGVRFLILLGSSIFISVGSGREIDRPEKGIAVPEIIESKDGSKCGRVRSLRLDHGQVVSAEWISKANDLDDATGAQTLIEGLLPFFRVKAILTPTSDSSIRVEVWLPPTARWNRKLKSLGSAGLGGAIPYAQLADCLKTAYTAAATETGHDGNALDGRFAMHHPQKIIDTQAYFVGCSQGGQEALMEAQRYPADYNGIIAGDPRLIQTRHEVGGHLWIASTLFSDPRNRITLADARVIGRAVNAACDRLDGVADGVLEDPRRCHFDPGGLQCRSSEHDNCLTESQVNTVRRLWAGPDQAIHADYYPGLGRGGEASLWQGWIVANTVAENLHGALGTEFFKYFFF